MGSSQIIEVLRTNRMHVVHEGLCGVPSGEYLRRRQRSRGDAMILTGQRCQQCIEANLFLYVIGKRLNFEVINIFLKNLVQLLALGSRQYYSDLSEPSGINSQYIWLQIDTCYYRQHLYGRTCKNSIISYQWLNVEQKNTCLLKKV